MNVVVLLVVLALHGALSLSLSPAILQSTAALPVCQEASYKPYGFYSPRQGFSLKHDRTDNDNSNIVKAKILKLTITRAGVKCEVRGGKMRGTVRDRL